jgi:deoxyuridine 5'-triphosphate nucleotidohydrolase
MGWAKTNELQDDSRITPPHVRQVFDPMYGIEKQLNEKQLREDDTMKLNVKIQRLNSEAIIPKYAREGDAGFDLVAVEDTIVEPGATVLVSTGLAFEIPPGYEMQIRPRSGVTVKTKLRVQIGTIDSGYRGEIKVMVDNIAPKRIHALATSLRQLTVEIRRCSAAPVITMRIRISYERATALPKR